MTAESHAESDADPNSRDRLEDLARIEEALDLASGILADLDLDRLDVQSKAGGSPVTEADQAVDRALREHLPREGEGWLSEETVDDLGRLSCCRVWVVDPIDGTSELISGNPEWSISVGLVENGRAVAGGIRNPMKDITVIGAVETGVTLNGEAVPVRRGIDLEGARVLASRSEVRRGEWDRFREREFEICPCGSVAYKLGMVAGGLGEATWTLQPKCDWDVVAGVALLESAGFTVRLLDGSVPEFNRGSTTKLSGIIGIPDPRFSPDWEELLGELCSEAE